MTATVQKPHEIVWSLTNGVIPSRCLHLVAELGVADLIEEEPVSATELASRCGADADALDRVLRLLATYGIFEYETGTYGQTPASRLLRSDDSMSMRAFPRMMGLPVFSTVLARLEHSVRTGSPALELVEPEGLWAYFQSHSDEGELFGQAMTAKAAADIASVLDAYDFTRFGTIVDVGGGRGHLLRAVLDAAPSARGVLFDLPEVVGALDVEHERLTAVAGDFFVDPLPAADAYVLIEVIHVLPDAESTAILSAIRRAAPEGTTVLIVENVIAEDVPDPRSRTLDVLMLAVTGGRERTPSEFRELLDRAGLRLSRVIETPGPLRLVEAA